MMYIRFTNICYWLSCFVGVLFLSFPSACCDTKCPPPEVDFRPPFRAHNPRSPTLGHSSHERSDSRGPSVLDPRHRSRSDDCLGVGLGFLGSRSSHPSMMHLLHMCIRLCPYVCRGGYCAVCLGPLRACPVSPESDVVFRLGK
ncbi:hypothetical protein FB45DRAFT_929044 [Roridomyces roridus]|uniref:Secreted protein n=1 Tax=Roridomyces roridus TaxID=1738132 RepID=A0AAD7BHP3_9AGAR|nr:hypothetical protein FB45DRAFT_929044 [Roridomyces roridus]